MIPFHDNGTGNNRGAQIKSGADTGNRGRKLKRTEIFYRSIVMLLMKLYTYFKMQCLLISGKLYNL